MIVAGIIAEYNPFHNGHLYQIKRIKEKLNPDYIIVVLGNNFSQRGETCILDKFDKTKVALSYGVDLVIEMPTIFSCSSAEHFAMAGVRLLNSLGIVTHLCFGTESNNLDKMIQISSTLVKEPISFKNTLKNELKKGFSFPVARSNALHEYFKNDNEIKEILSLPNNILAIEYIKELLRLKSNIKPYLIKRNGPGFYSAEIKDNISSATNIRNLIKDNENIEKFIPEETNKLINEYKNNYLKLIDIDDFSDILLYKLKTLSSKDLENINEVREGIQNTLLETSKKYFTISEIVSNSKSKRFTYTSITRIISYILLNVTKDDFKKAKDSFPKYVRILGFKSSSEKLLSEITKTNIKNKSKTTIITNVNKFIKENEKNKSKKIKSIINELQKEITYNNIYHIKLDNKTNSDYTQKMIVL